jgi:hypothetical protein
VARFPVGIIVQTCSDAHAASYSAGPGTLSQEQGTGYSYLSNSEVKNTKS